MEYEFLPFAQSFPGFLLAIIPFINLLANTHAFFLNVFCHCIRVTYRVTNCEPDQGAVHSTEILSVLIVTGLTGNAEIKNQT